MTEFTTEDLRRKARREVIGVIKLLWPQLKWYDKALFAIALAVVTFGYFMFFAYVGSRM